MNPNTSRNLLAAAIATTSLLTPLAAWAQESTALAPEVLVSFTGESGDFPGGTTMMPPVVGKTEGKTAGYIYGTAGNMEGSLKRPLIYRFNPQDIAGTYSAAPFHEDADAASRLSLAEDGQGNLYASLMTFAFRVPGFYVSKHVKFNGEDLSREFISTVPQSTAGSSGTSFVNADGEQARDTDGNVYFPAKAEGRTGLELLIRRDSATGAYTVVRDFATYPANPVAEISTYLHSIIYSEADQALYTLAGPGKINDGDTPRGAVLVKIPLATVTDDGNSPLEVLTTMDYTVHGKPGKGQSLQSTLLEDGNFLYGTASEAGETAQGERARGTLWRFNKSTRELSIVHYFGLQEGDGHNPYGTLVKADDGHIYGSTDKGGANGQSGTLFRIRVGSEPDRSDDQYEQLHSFATDTEGSRPTGLTDGGAGVLYGTAREGGTQGYGTLFRLEYPLPEVHFTTDLRSSTISATQGETIALSWAVEHTAGCTASGDNGNAWSGEQAANGADVEITLTQAGTNTFALSCDALYDGGQAVSQSIDVEVAEADNGGPATPEPPSSSGGSGGGAFNPLFLLPIGLGLPLLRRRRAFRK